MPTGRVKEFLNAQGVRYISIHHSPAYTAQEVAASAHVPGKELAKTVMVKLDGRMAMAVLPASYKVDFGALAAAAGVSKAELATEAEFKDLFPECELGAMPPFGNLYGMEVYAAKRLAEDAEIAFNAGTHRELIRLRYEDFSRLVHPRLVSFAL
ncbi:MAG: YbaK/EbsC family protein [Candidatus Eisenbacteria bacterium]|nr:YbaK/EbsC family protein [Candidatus Eisenbacteria bacterium]